MIRTLSMLQARYVLPGIAVLLSVALAPCSLAAKITKKARVNEASAATLTPPHQAPSEVCFTDNEAMGENLRNFEYTWPLEVSAVPQLLVRFTTERNKLLAEQKHRWKGSLYDNANIGCLNCSSNEFFTQDWEVVTNLERFLSLSATVSVYYSGTLHGIYWMDALIWDRKAKHAFNPKAMFRSQAALQSVLGARWCKALRNERAKRLAQPDYIEDSVFPCPPIANLTLLLGSSNKKTFDYIDLIAAPYVAGSYSEGLYEITLPITAKVIAAVKPEYTAFFTLGK